MGGFCGWISKTKCSEQNENSLKIMLESVVHRGPDASGTYLDEHMALGAATVLTRDVVTEPEPVISKDNRFVIALDGYIRNREALVDRLRSIGSNILSTKDAHVALELYRYFGPQGFSKIVGSFALVLWDIQEQTAVFARDEYGFKPLFYSYNNDHLVFGSEAKAVLLGPNVNAQIDEKSVHNFLNFKFLPGPVSLFKDVLQIKPGTLIIWSPKEQSKEALKVVEQPETGEACDLIVEALVENYDYPSETVNLIEPSPQSILSASIFGREMPEVTNFYQFADDTKGLNGEAFNSARHALTYKVTNEPSPRLTVQLFKKMVRHLELPMPEAFLPFLRYQSMKRQFKIGMSSSGFAELFLMNQGQSILRKLELVNKIPLEKILDWTADFLEWKYNKRKPNPWLGSDAFKRIDLIRSVIDPPLFFAIFNGMWDDKDVRKEIYGEAMLSHSGSLNDSFDLFDQLWTKRRTSIHQLREYERGVGLKYKRAWIADRSMAAVGLQGRYPFANRRVYKAVSRIKTEDMCGSKGPLPFVQDLFSEYLDPTIWSDFKSPDLDLGFDRTSFSADLNTIYGIYLSEKMVQRYRLFNPTFVKKMLAIRTTDKNQWQHQMIFYDGWTACYL